MANKKRTTSVRIASVAKAGKRAGRKPGKLGFTSAPKSNTPYTPATPLSNFRIVIGRFSDRDLVDKFRRAYHRASGNPGFANPDVVVNY